MNKTQKTIFSCQACGYQTAKWMGKCPDCGEWQSFVEEAKATKGRPGFASGTILTRSQPIAIDAIKAERGEKTTSIEGLAMDAEYGKS